MKLFVSLIFALLLALLAFAAASGGYFGARASIALAFLAFLGIVSAFAHKG